MNQDKNRIQHNLSIHLEQYIAAIIEKYGKYIPQARLDVLNNISDFAKIIKIYDYGSINACANASEIKMPLCADKVLNFMSKIPGYGINKNHQSYNQENLINNDNTFSDYIYHVFITGTNVEGYYEDLLLHETMHFCGSGGATALKEGINELLTRKLALEKNFRTNGCAYPKEIQIAFELQQIYGEEILNQIAFINSEKQIYMFLENTIDKEAAELYLNISNIMEREFYPKYYSNMDSFNGITGIIRKTTNYNKIDYSSVHELLNNYSILQVENKQHKYK